MPIEQAAQAISPATTDPAASMTPRKAFVGELISEAVAICIVMTFGLSVAAMYTLYDPSPYKTAYWGSA
ncbi:hypothetical protein QP162_01865 [Sphingomonas aurantiaca]|uniref:hypothetical protein n=1 Tax=Sphingomonas aurantiaca TaxID=185949 RepID=UPI002FE033E4